MMLLNADRARGWRLKAGGWSQKASCFFSFLTPAPSPEPPAIFDLPTALFRKAI